MTALRFVCLPPAAFQPLLEYGSLRQMRRTDFVSPPLNRRRERERPPENEWKWQTILGFFFFFDYGAKSGGDWNTEGMRCVLIVPGVGRPVGNRPAFSKGSAPWISRFFHTVSRVFCFVLFGIRKGARSGHATRPGFVSCLHSFAC